MTATEVSSDSGSPVQRDRSLALYIVFAVIATAANLLAQEAVIRIAPAALAASILAGTIVGFVLKYALDKKYVFRDSYVGARREAWKVVLYGSFSVFTTLIFWGFEAAFWLIWNTPFAKYTGAVLGLAIGYVLKFWLDGRFVFRRPAA